MISCRLQYSSSCGDWQAYRKDEGPRVSPSSDVYLGLSVLITQQLLVNAALSLGGLVDLMTTAMLSYYLYQHRTLADLPRYASTHKLRVDTELIAGFSAKYMVEKLAYFSLNTGALTM